MTAFITLASHFAACYLHFLLAYRFYPQRHNDSVVFYFWLMMVLWVVMHLLYGMGLFLEILGVFYQLNKVIEYICYSMLTFITCTWIPVLIGELKVAPAKMNLLSAFLMLVSRYSNYIFYFVFVVCIVDFFVTLPQAIPIDQWRGDYGNKKALYGVLILGSVWVAMFLVGIRPVKENLSGLGKAIQVLFPFLLLIILYETFIDDFEHWSVIPIASSMSFSLVFSLYRFRLQFMDMILNQSVNIVMLIAGVAGLGQLISSVVFAQATASLQYVLITGYVIIVMILYRFISQQFSSLWVPADTILKQMHGELPAKLAACDSEQAAMATAEQFIATSFHCEVAINRAADFEVQSTIKLKAEPAVELRLSYMRGWIPWLSQASSWATTALMYLQSQLQLQKSHLNAMRVKELANLAARAELNAMRAQIRPHFLFNTLNSIHSFVRDDPDQAEHVIEKLSELMRSVLSSPDEDTISLEKEINTVNNYLAIEQARYGARLQYEVNIDPSLLQVQIPPFSIQPLVENAIKYAVDGQFEPVHLSVGAFESQLQMVIYVTDDGPGLGNLKEGLGIATKNINDRLHRIFGDSATLKLFENESGGVTAQIELAIESNRLLECE